MAAAAPANDPVVIPKYPQAAAAAADAQAGPSGATAAGGAGTAPAAAGGAGAAPPRHDDSESDGTDYDSEDGDQNEGNNAIEPCAFEGPIYDHQKEIEPPLKTWSDDEEQKKRTKMVELVSMTKKEEGVNKPRGIQALFNSSSTDCTLYSMFAFNDSFDYLFEKKLGIPQDANSPMRILMRHIVIPLRKVGFVGAKRIVALKLALQRVGSLGTRSVVEVRKPARFLDDLLLKGLRVDPQIKYIETSMETNPPPPETMPLNALRVAVGDNAKQQSDYFTIDHLIERWTLTEKRKLASINNLVVQLDRSGDPFDEPIVVLPFLKVALEHCMYGVPRYCSTCINKPDKPDPLPLAVFECSSCFGSDNTHMKLEQCSFCEKCNKERHAPDNEAFRDHEVLPIAGPTRPYTDTVEENGKKVYKRAKKYSSDFELFAIVCANVTGYVAYARTDVDPDLVKNEMKKFLAPLDEEPPLDDPVPGSGAAPGPSGAQAAAAQPQAAAPGAGASNAGAGAGAGAGAAGGSNQQQQQQQSEQSASIGGDNEEPILWVYFDPEAILKDDVRGGFNVPQVHMVDKFHTLIDYRTLDKSSGYINALDQDVNKQHQYRIMCESSALFYRKKKEEQKKQ